MSTATPTRPATTPPTPHSPPGSLEILRLVTVREIRERGRTKSFIIGVVASLLLLGAGIVLPQLIGDDAVEYTVGSLGEGNDSIMRVAETTARDGLDEGEELTFEVIEYEDEAAARAALTEGDVELVVVDGDRILREGSVGFSGSDLQDTIQQAASVVQLEDRLEGTDVTVEEVAGAFGGEPLPVSTVDGEVDSDLETARSLIAYGGMVMLYFAILMFGMWTLMGVAEEKSSRVVEVLLSTVKPWQLLAGKILGIGLLGLGQFVITVVWILGLVRVTDVVSLPAIPVDSALTLVLWFTLGYATYAVAFATAGALVSRMEDAQNVSFPVSMIAILGFFVSFGVLDDPSGLLAQVTTYVPFVSPFVVPIRVAYSAITWWEQLVSVGITLVAIVLLVRVAGRIYAGGLLQFGGRLKVRQAWRSAEG